MSVSDLDVKGQFQGNGVTVNFTIPFAYQNESEIEVWKRDETDAAAITETLLVQGALQDYTLTGATPPTTPLSTTVHMRVAPTSTQYIQIRRVLPLTQSTSLGNTVSTVVQALVWDKLTMLVQQVNELVSRAPKFQKTWRGSIPEYKEITDQCTVIYDEATNAFIPGPAAADLTNATANAAAAAASAAAAAANAAASAAAQSATDAAAAAASASSAAATGNAAAAAASAAAAAISATNAATSASAASTSATAAATSATAAAGSATTASTQATNAATSAAAAAVSATNAVNSATAAATSATAAATSATAAATSATAAATSASAASASETAAAASAASAAASASINMTTDTFTGDGATVAFVLSVAPGAINHTLVFIDGVYQFKTTDYTLAGSTITFGSAPASGVSIQVVTSTTVAAGVPSDGAVTKAKLSSTALDKTVVSTAIDRVLLATDQDIEVDTTAANRLITLLNPATYPGKEVVIRKTSNDLKICTITDGTYSTTVNTIGEVVKIRSNGTAWKTVYRYTPSDDYNLPLTATLVGLGGGNAALIMNRRGNKALLKAQTLTGVVSAVPAYIQLPAGIAIDVSVNSAARQIGWCRRRNNAGNTNFASGAYFALFYDGSNVDRAYLSNANASFAYSTINGSVAFGNSENFEAELEFSVAGWGG